MNPLSLISGGFFAVARSGQGRGAAQRTLDGEDCREIVRERERGRSCFYLAARFAEEHGARFGRRALERRGNQVRRRARDRARPWLVLHRAIRRPGRALADDMNAALSDASSAACGVCDPKGCFG